MLVKKSRGAAGSHLKREMTLQLSGYDEGTEVVLRLEAQLSISMRRGKGEALQSELSVHHTDWFPGIL